MNQNVPKWFIVLINVIVIAGLWLLCGWILTWAWYLSLHGVFGVAQMSYSQALGLIALLAVVGGVVFRVIPALLSVIFYSSGVHAVQTPLAPSQQMQQMDAVLQDLQQMMQQSNVQAAVPPQQPATTPKTRPATKPNPLKLKDGPTEWEE